MSEQHNDQKAATQIERVLAALERGGWLTLPELHEITGDAVASISGTIRNLRKPPPEGGSHTIIKRRRGENRAGYFEYRLLRNDQPPERAA